MFKTLAETLGVIADNVWAFLLFVIAAIIALVSHFGHDKDLLGFASTVAMTAAALFHGKSNKEGGN